MIHRLTETMKFVYAHRTAFGDEEYIKMTDLLRNITSTGYAKQIFELIDDTRTHAPPYYRQTIKFNESAAKDDHGTSHMSILSREGDAVSMTMSVNYM